MFICNSKKADKKNTKNSHSEAFLRVSTGQLIIEEYRPNDPNCSEFCGFKDVKTRVPTSPDVTGVFLLLTNRLFAFDGEEDQHPPPQISD